MLNKELTEELVVEEKIDFPSVTVEGSTASHVKNWNNIYRTKMNLMDHYTVFHGFLGQSSGS